MVSSRTQKINDHTIILFGRSEYLYKIEKFVPDLLKKYHSIGCNQIVEYFNDIENAIFFDDVGKLNITENTHLIAPAIYTQNSNRKSFKFLENHKNKELYEFYRNGKVFSKEKGTLNFYIHTPSLALNWCYQNNFRNVILAGVDLEPENSVHFASHQPFMLDEEKRILARKHLEKVCTKYLRIYQLNAESTLNIDKINIKEL